MQLTLCKFAMLNKILQFAYSNLHCAILGTQRNDWNLALCNLLCANFIVHIVLCKVKFSFCKLQCTYCNVQIGFCKFPCTIYIAQFCTFDLDSIISIEQIVLHKFHCANRIVDIKLLVFVQRLRSKLWTYKSKFLFFCFSVINSVSNFQGDVARRRS